MGKDMNPFEEYYNESQDKPGGEKWSEILPELEKKAEQKEKAGKASGDAKSIREPINLFIKKLNAMIGEIFKAEKEKKTRPDLIITLIVGGLAFTVANVFYLVTRNMGAKMSAEEYEETFLGMYRAAIRNIGKDNK